MDSHTLRPTTPKDIPTLHRLMHDFAAYERLEHRFAITEAGLHDVLFGLRPALDSILAEVDATPVGFALWYFTFGTFSGRWGLFVEDIYVEPAQRGRGIGLALFRHMAGVALARDCVDMQWNVLDWNAPAIAFYRRIGAKPIEGWIPQQLSGEALAALAQGAGNG